MIFPNRQTPGFESPAGANPLNIPDVGRSSEGDSAGGQPETGLMKMKIDD